MGQQRKNIFFTGLIWYKSDPEEEKKQEKTKDEKRLFTSAIYKRKTEAVPLKMNKHIQ